MEVIKWPRDQIYCKNKYRTEPQKPQLVSSVRGRMSVQGWKGVAKEVGGELNIWEWEAKERSVSWKRE